MVISMLKKEDRIFQNLYNEYGWELEKSLMRDDWKNTNQLISKGRDWIIDEIKTLLEECKKYGEGRCSSCLFFCNME